MKKQLQSYIKELRDSGRNNWKEWCFGAILFAQRENMISFEDAEDTAELYTADPVWIRKMDKLTQQNPEQFKLKKAETYQGAIVAKRYTLPKRFVSIKSKERRLTDEQRAKLAARFRKGQQDGV